MNFLEIAKNRQSCRSYDLNRPVEQEKLNAVLEAACLAPSACNAQPYHFTVCRGEAAKAAAKACQGLGMNKFVSQAPVLIIVSEQSYSKSAAMGARVKNNDYRSIDIGIAAAYLTAEATAQGLSSCILGWIDDKKLRKITGLDTPARLVITLGYAAEGDPHRPKQRKALDMLVSIKD
ncbi:MAG: nitroreductase family protein [Clostridiales bacterium]|nr:nitroreductase family protein [Clostridiales bacterium]